MIAKPEPDDWGVFVNECGVLAVGGEPATWWVHFWARTCPDRITTLVLSVAGGHHHVACDTKDDAEFLRSHMVAQGIAPSHVAIRRLSAAKATAAKRKAASDEKLELERRAWMARNTTTDGPGEGIDPGNRASRDPVAATAAPQPT